MAKRTAASELNQDNWQEDDAPEEAGTWNKASSSELANRAIKKAVRRTAYSSGQSDDKPAVFKNFSGFATKESSTKTPMFSFDKSSNSAVSKFSFGSASSDKSKSPDNTSKGLPSTFTNPSFSFANSSIGAAKPVGESKLETTSSSSSFTNPTFTFGGSKTTEAPKTTNGSTSINVNGSAIADSGSKSKDDDYNDNYLADLKALNVSVKNWINQHVDKNPHLNLEPVFIDYRKHFLELQKTHSTSKISDESTKRDDSQLAENKISNPTFSFTSTTETKDNSLQKQDTFKSSLFSGSSPKSNVGFSFGFDKNKEHQKSSSDKFSFGKDTTKDAAKSTFSFGSTSTTTTSLFGSGDSVSTGFSFGNTTSLDSSKSSFSFGSSLENKESKSETNKEEEPSDEPPKVEVEVKEENSFYEMKCKLFYKKDSNYVDKGVGMLFLKKVGEKTQMIIRNVTKLGTILLNIVLTSSLPIQRLGKKDLLIVCVPNPPIDSSNAPVSMLIRVKTPEDADELFEKLKENKN